MGFEDIEERLRIFFRETCEKQERSAKFIETKNTILEVYTSGQKRCKPRGFFVARFTSALFSLLFVYAFNSFFVDSSEPVQAAGAILPKFGLIEVVRGGEMILIKEHTTLKVGDIVRVGNNAEAEIIFPNQLISTAKKRTDFQVLEGGGLYLEKGLLENEALQNSEILVQRGIVESPSGSRFNVYVSESGEARITSEYSGVNVMDFNERKVALKEGDEFLLRTDTLLSEYAYLPPDLELSARQLRAINSKLIISRSKILTGVENSLRGAVNEAAKDFLSAEKSYKSIAQVLFSSRNLEIMKRKNLEALAIADVLPLLEMKVKNEYYLSEAKAIEDLFTIFKQQKDRMAFSLGTTGVESFDRFVTLKRLYTLAEKEQRVHEEVLLQKYIVAFLRQIQNEELRIDQLSMLNEQIKKLPKTELAYEFLDRASKIFAPDIAMILNEKIESVF